MSSAKLIDELKRSSLQLNNKSTMYSELMVPFMEILSSGGIAVTGQGETGFDLRALVRGVPPSYLVLWANTRHDKLPHYKHWDNIDPERGVRTMAMASIPGFLKGELYEKRYAPFGIKDIVQSVYYDPLGNRLGLHAAIRYSSTYSTEEVALFDTLSPYLFYAYLKYRWLVEIDFFGDTDKGEALYGVVCARKDGRITYMNNLAKAAFSNLHESVPTTLTEEFIKGVESMEALIAPGGGERVHQSAALNSPYGSIMPFRCGGLCKEQGGKDIDADYLFVIEVRYIDNDLAESITGREREVLVCIGEGLRDKEIGKRLSIAPKTVNAHISNILRKLDAKNRTDAYSMAKGLKIV